MKILIESYNLARGELVVKIDDDEQRRWNVGIPTGNKSEDEILFHAVKAVSKMVTPRVLPDARVLDAMVGKTFDAKGDADAVAAANADAQKAKAENAPLVRLLHRKGFIDDRDVERLNIELGSDAAA